MLLVVDDAIYAGQLHPLLPAGGAVIITSRRRMLGLGDATHRELLKLSDEISAEHHVPASTRPSVRRPPKPAADI